MNVMTFDKIYIVSLHNTLIIHATNITYAVHRPIYVICANFYMPVSCLQDKKTKEPVVRYLKTNYPTLLCYRGHNDGLPYPPALFKRIDEFPNFDALAYRLRRWVHFRWKDHGLSTALVVCSLKRTAETIYNFLLNCQLLPGEAEEDDKEEGVEGRKHLKLPYMSVITSNRLKHPYEKEARSVACAIELAVKRDIVTIISPVVGPGVSNCTPNSYDAVFLFADLNPHGPNVDDIAQQAARFRSITKGRLFYAVRCTAANSSSCGTSSIDRLETALEMHQPGYKKNYESLLAAQRQEADQHMRVCCNATYAQLVVKQTLIDAFTVFDENKNVDDDDDDGDIYVLEKPKHRFNQHAECLSISKHVRPVRRAITKLRRKNRFAMNMDSEDFCDSRPVQTPITRQQWQQYKDSL